MQYPELAQFKDAAQSLPSNPSKATIQETFCMAKTADLMEVYTPFEFVNKAARVAIVGITPGFTQVQNAILSLSNALKTGMADEKALQMAKQTGAFSGSLRKNLIDLLNSIGLDQYLGIADCAELFANRNDLIQSCSILKNGVFKFNKRKGTWENYNGTPDIIKNDFLRNRVERFGKQTAQFPKGIIYIALGPVVSSAFEYLISQGVVDAKSVFSGLIHPAPGNNERIAAWLERKPFELLSAKTPRAIAEGYLQTKASLRKRLLAL